MSGIDTPMVFEQLRDSLLTLLQTKGGSRFRAIGVQHQTFSSQEIEGDLRTVQVFLNTSDYPPSGKQIFKHDVPFQLLLSVSSPTKGDKAVIDDDNASASARQTALLAVQEGINLVDKSMDELWRMVTQILKDPANEEIGLADYVVSDPNLTGFRKNQVLEKGTLTVLTAQAAWSAHIDETTPGITGVAAVQPAIDVTLNEQPVSGDEVLEPPKVGVQTDQ